MSYVNGLLEKLFLHQKLFRMSKTAWNKTSLYHILKYCWRKKSVKVHNIWMQLFVIVFHLNKKNLWAALRGTYSFPKKENVITKFR